MASGLVAITALAQPLPVDIPWHETSYLRWERRIGGIGGQATLEIDKTGNKTIHRLTRPCRFHPNRNYTISWQEGRRFGTGIDCLGHSGYSENIEGWKPYFSPGQD